MGDSNPTTLPFCAPSAFEAGLNDRFVFSSAVDKNGAKRKARVRKFGSGTAPRRTTSSGPHPPSTLTQQSSAAPSSSHWKFVYPQTAFDEETEEINPGCPPHENEMPENVKVYSSPPSALTGVIPCYFEESRYSSQPPASPLSPSTRMNQVIVKEEPDEQEQSSSQSSEQSSSHVSEQSSFQLILVSRILKGIPHNPHFLPLKDYSEFARLSLTSAWDCIFEQVVVQIQSMQLNNFWVNATRLWGTMGELQNMGYNVIPVRRRLVELTDVMLSLTRHKSEINVLKKKAEQHKMEKSILEFEIEKLRARVEAEKAWHDEVLLRLENKVQEIPKIDNVFFKIATKKIDAR